MNSSVLIKQYGSLIQLLGFGIISNCCHYRFKNEIIIEMFRCQSLVCNQGCTSKSKWKCTGLGVMETAFQILILLMGSFLSEKLFRNLVGSTKIQVCAFATALFTSYFTFHVHH